MRGFTLLGKEFTEIIKSKKILIPIIAVLFVPLLYAGMFLWAFWDPYEQLDDLPVAVVNLDKGAVFDGKPIEVGKGLVDELKDNKSFKWEFVSEKTAKEGMENRKYYMLVRIPENFSDNATTLLKENPRPLNLEYIPNESLNFLSSQIGGTAIEKIKGEVSNTLTKTYAEKMFDSIKDVSKGFADGADGANKLHDGSVELQDGSGKVTDGLHTLQGKSGEMKDGVGQLLDGSGKLLDGSGQVSSGLNLLNSKTGELKNGIGQLVDGSGQLYEGLNNLAGKSIQFNDGLKRTSDGSSELQKGTTDLSSGMKQLGSAQGQLEQGAQKIQKGLQDLNNQLQNAATGLSDMKTNVPAVLKQANEQITRSEEKVNQLNEVAQSNAGDANKAAQDVAALKEQIEKLSQESQEKLKPFITTAANSTATVQKKSAEVAGATTQLKKEVSQLTVKVNETTNGLQTKLPNPEKLNTLVAGVEVLTKGQNEFVGKFQEFGKELSTATTGAEKLATGGLQLNDGISQLAENGPKLVTGVSELVNGAGKLNGGLNKLSEGSGQLVAGVNKLADGSNKVTNGLGTLNGGLNKMSDGSGKLIDGVNQLADGSGKVTDGLVKVNDGSGELATKLGEGAEKTGKVKGTDKTYNMFADPVKVQTEKMSEVPNYGTGFTPYFLSLGLFVGALLLSIVYPLRDTVGVPKSGFSWFISKFGVLLSVGIIQALVADLVLLLGLGVEVQSVPYFILFSILTSLAFIALIQCLVTAFGDAGRFIAILTLIMQLTTSAGTFPLELIPKFLQHFNAWLPMTYSVSGFKAVVSSGDFGFMWQNAGILMIFIVLLSLGTIGSLTWMHKRQFRNLVEEKSIEA
ncbi:phage infection protein [Bacillus pseudomycoides]|uniref:YhgE/Pip domain-containing protein n=1 Tax=Bacillus pseudomycoides TaxID=64104 RepID=UPI000BEBD340|nr:YhgE/Pip domain-containing protein [Bacillus pseudomycoides]PEF73024.1 phage infection protein [Bacillus pseudomycoides]PEJ23061.1 phage infection protein [Bacillus pseudomycoides]PEL83933.1 phage infection protein [Bacillus pseudomycoides]PHG30558.1 phage infection protein [Bacillus pseudomycoides]